MDGIRNMASKHRFQGIDTIYQGFTGWEQATSLNVIRLFTYKSLLIWFTASSLNVIRLFTHKSLFIWFTAYSSFTDIMLLIW